MLLPFLLGYRDIFFHLQLAYLHHQRTVSFIIPRSLRGRRGVLGLAVALVTGFFLVLEGRALTVDILWGINSPLYYAKTFLASAAVILCSGSRLTIPGGSSRRTVFGVSAI